MDKRKQVMEYAVEGFRKGLNCSESVFNALQRAGLLNVPEESIAMCVGFGGGIGLTGHTCGALSGAVMGVGAVHGRANPWAVPDDERGPQIAQKLYRQYNRLTNDFIDLNGSALCREITAGYSWQDKERKVKCLKIIESTAGLAYDYVTMSKDQAQSMEYRKNMSGLT